MTDFVWYTDSPLGGITMASDGTHLVGLWFDGQAFFACGLAKEHEEKDLPIFQETERWLAVYFSGERPDFTPPLLLRGTSFQREVWDILLTIPYGETMTYGEIAAQMAARKGIAKMSAQAVGGAVGHNPVTLVVPCHRVVGAKGNLTGYAGGLERKVRLLELEKGMEGGVWFRYP